MLPQARNCSKTFGSGSPLQTLGRITTLRASHNTSEPRHGGYMVKRSQSGNIPAQVHSCGYTGNVSVFAVIMFPQLMVFTFAAGAGKSVLW